MAQRIVVDPITRIEGHLRIEAEINRLFVYDVMEMFPKHMDIYYDIGIKEAQSKLMKYLYSDKKGAKTQVQRALREASDRMVN